MLKSNLKYLRRRRGYEMTQQQLAEKVGVTVITIYFMEKGKGANLMTLRKVAKALDCKIDDLYDWEGV